jgi:hypothetical protein
MPVQMQEQRRKNAVKKKAFGTSKRAMSKNQTR